jgi:hypothetical protein
MIDARTLTLTLGGRWAGRSGNAPCPVCQPERRRDQDALSLRDDGGRLLVFCHKRGCTFVEVLDALGGRGPNVSPRPAMPPPRGNDDARRERQARAIWAEALPIRDTLAERYLRGRAITCDLPDTLRFHSEGWHAAGRRWPMLVALVDGGAGLAVHRTYLAPDGLGKAPVDPVKAMLGGCAGGAVRLSEDAGRLVVCEGIETGLSLLSGLLPSPARVWAALSTSGLRGLHLPPEPGRLTIAGDGDDPGRAAAYALASRAEALGWTVSLLSAPAGHDWNDVLVDEGAK